MNEILPVRWSALAWPSCRRHQQDAVALRQLGERGLPGLREKLVKIGAKVVRHGHYVTLQLAEIGIWPTGT